MTTSEKIKAQDKKSSHLSTKATISKQKNSIKRFVLAFALLFGLVLYITFSYKELWLGAINRIDIFGHNNNIKDIESSSEEQGSISKKVDKIVEDADKDENKNQANSLAPQDGEDLPRFDPDKQDLNILNEEEDLNPYDHEIKEIIDDNTQIISDVNMINNLNPTGYYIIEDVITKQITNYIEKLNEIKERLNFKYEVIRLKPTDDKKSHLDNNLILISRDNFI